jgi:hypothetical protein
MHRVVLTAAPSSVIRRLCPPPSPSSPDVDRQLSPPGSALCISVVRMGWDETRHDETRRDSTRLDEGPASSNGKASSHPHSHTLTRPGPTSPLPGAALVAAPLDEHAGSRINYSLPGSRRPRRPSALWPSRSCPGARLAYPAPALPCPALPCPGRLYTMAHVSPQLHLAQHGSRSMATLPRPRRP